MNTTRYMIMTATASLLLAVAVQAEPLITSISRGGSLTWSNYLPNATYRVEWATSANGPWNTNPPSWVISSTSHVTSAEIPLFFRVAWLDPPDIRYVVIDEVSTVDHEKGFDLTGDGQVDIFIMRWWYSLSENHWTVHVVAKAYRIAATPRNEGDIIGPETDWDAEDDYVLLGAYSAPGAFSWGPWSGVTDAYIPVALSISDNTHYGWVRMHLTEKPIIHPQTGLPTGMNAYSYFLEDAAWHKIPDTPIMAGQLE